MSGPEVRACQGHWAVQCMAPCQSRGDSRTLSHR